jgi:hypothetical protein
VGDREGGITALWLGFPLTGFAYLDSLIDDLGKGMADR